MNQKTRYEIDDTDRIRPHLRLCHRILRESLMSGVRTVQLDAPGGELPTARAEVGGAWKPFMSFPVAVYTAFVAYLKEMAGPDGTILVRVAGQDAAVTLTVRPNDLGAERLVLRFPTTIVTKAAV